MKGRQISAFLIALCMFWGCCAAPAPTSPSTEATQITTEATEPTEDPMIPYLRKNLPVMDGSTSLIPLEAGIRAAIFDVSMEEATAQVSHSSTWNAFYNLLDGIADLIFSCPLSEQQLLQAEYSGVSLELVPIAMEGFVFVVNADNPVDTLTQQQIRDIYSGKITNWSEVGGLDEAIIPYQRNEDSGSQNFMSAFMGDTPLMDAPTDLRPASMSGLMDVIAVNDNSRASIGYSVYAYAADMYGNGDEIKFIQVDGVAPSKATFANGEYPLLGQNYAVFRADEPKNSPVRQLVDWLLTEQGQRAIAKAGYVTVLDVGHSYTESTVEKYQGIGTGPAASESPSIEYVLLDAFTYDSDYTFATPKLIPEVHYLEDGTTTYRITGLKNEALMEEINNWIDLQMLHAKQWEAQMHAQLEKMNLDETYRIYEPGFLWDGTQPEGMETACTVTAKNGYLSVAITAGYTYNVFYSYDRSYITQTATWDLFTGEKLNPEDLFCQGVEIHTVLNEYLRTYSMSPVDHTGFVPELVQDFAALPETDWHITHDTLYFDFDNPYFRQGEIISLSGLPDGILSCQIPRDFSSCLAPGNDLSCQEQFRIIDRDQHYCYSSDGYTTYALPDEDSHPNAALIAQKVETYLETYFTEDAVRKYYESQGYGYNCPIDTGMGIDWDLTRMGNDYLLFHGNSPVAYIGDDIVPYPYSPTLLFSLKTGEEIQWQDMLVDGWQDVLPLQNYDCILENYDPAELESDYMYIIQNDWGAPFCVAFTDGTHLEIPIEWIKH